MSYVRREDALFNAGVALLGMRPSQHSGCKDKAQMRGARLHDTRGSYTVHSGPYTGLGSRSRLRATGCSHQPGKARFTVLGRGGRATAGAPACFKPCPVYSHNEPTNVVVLLHTFCFSAIINIVIRCLRLRSCVCLWRQRGTTCTGNGSRPRPWASSRDGIESGGATATGGTSTQHSGDTRTGLSRAIPAAAPNEFLMARVPRVAAC